MKNPDVLDGELREAEEELKSTLEQACATDVARADTGELIRVEEMLAIASDAAKKAISIRRKRRDTRRRREVGPPAQEALPPHLTFTADDGAVWTVRAVRPARVTASRTRLPGDFEHGWLAFENGEAKRRLSPIPDGWEELDEAGLRELCRQATPAPGRRGEAAG